MLPSGGFAFTSSDGLRIACNRWDAGGQVRGVVQIAHGMGEHIGRYAETICFLTRSGLTVYGNDHRGHGHTAPSPQSFGDFGPGGFDLLVEDVARLSRIARQENPNAPFLLLGHSMGSFAAQQYAQDRSCEIDGLILSGTGALDGLARLARSAPIGDLLNSAFDPARTPFDWLSRDDAVVDAFMDDPLCFAELRPDALQSFLASGVRLADPARLRKIRNGLPVYIFAGGDDPVGQQLEGVQALIERYREAGLSDISHDFYAGGRHEMLNETNRTEVRERLLRWISQMLTRSSSGAKTSSMVH
jgi:alpha-beta hydrolase superfamily lysophospholipase